MKKQTNSQNKTPLKGDNITKAPNPGKITDNSNATAKDIFSQQNAEFQKQLAVSKKASTLPVSAAVPVRPAPGNTAKQVFQGTPDPASAGGEGDGITVPKSLLMKLLSALPEAVRASYSAQLKLKV